MNVEESDESRGDRNTENSELKQTSDHDESGGEENTTLSVEDQHPEQEEYEDDQVTPILLPYSTTNRSPTPYTQSNGIYLPQHIFELPPYRTLPTDGSTDPHSPTEKSSDHGEDTAPQDGTADAESDPYNDFITTVRRIMAESPFNASRTVSDGDEEDSDDELNGESPSSEEDDGPSVVTNFTPQFSADARLAHLLRYYDDTVLLPQRIEEDEGGDSSCVGDTDGSDGEQGEEDESNEDSCFGDIDDSDSVLPAISFNDMQ